MKEVNNEALEMMVNKVDAAVITLSDKLGVASDHFYPILVEQHYLSGWIWVWTAAPILLVGLFFTWFSVQSYKSNDHESSFWLGFVAAITYIFFGAVLANNLTPILNPEYYALMEIKSFIK